MTRSSFAAASIWRAIRLTSLRSFFLSARLASSLLRRARSSSAFCCCPALNASAAVSASRASVRQISPSSSRILSRSIRSSRAMSPTVVRASKAAVISPCVASIRSNTSRTSSLSSMSPLTPA